MWRTLAVGLALLGISWVLKFPLSHIGPRATDADVALLLLWLFCFFGGAVATVAGIIRLAMHWLRVPRPGGSEIHG